MCADPLTFHLPQHSRTCMMVVCVCECVCMQQRHYYCLLAMLISKISHSSASSHLHNLKVAHTYMHTYIRTLQQYCFCSRSLHGFQVIPCVPNNISCNALKRNFWIKFFIMRIIPIPIQISPYFITCNLSY